MKETVRGEGIIELRKRRLLMDNLLQDIDPEGLLDQEHQMQIKRRKWSLKKIMRKVVLGIADDLKHIKDERLQDLNDLYNSMIHTTKFYHKRYVDDACRAYERGMKNSLRQLESSFAGRAFTWVDRYKYSETFDGQAEHFTDLPFLQEHLVAPSEVEGE